MNNINDTNRLRKRLSEEKKDKNKNKLIPAAGSGFIVSQLGHIVTNNHVINGCETVKANYKESYDTTILATDGVNDLALLEVEFSPSTIFY